MSITPAQTATTYRLTAAGGDEQDFISLDVALREAQKYLDPEKLGASWVKIAALTNTPGD